MKQRLLFIICAFFVLPLTACGAQETQNNKNVLAIETKGGEQKFNIELALTQEEQMQGLMNRTSMAEDAGMLFYFGDEAERGFWMKNTLIPLDLIFIKANGTIHHIHENAVPQDLTSIRSNGPVAAVLEINGGLAHKLGISVGNNVKHPFFNVQSGE